MSCVTYYTYYAIINPGVNYHVGEALGDTLNQARNNIVSIGIPPWGVIHKREDLIGSEVYYMPMIIVP